MYPRYLRRAHGGGQFGILHAAAQLDVRVPLRRGGNGLALGAIADYH